MNRLYEASKMLFAVVALLFAGIPISIAYIIFIAMVALWEAVEILIHGK